MIVLAIVYSYKFDMNVIPYCLFVQAIQMMLSNFNVYTSFKDAALIDGVESYDNFEGLNMLSSVFSVMFNIFNTILMVFVIKETNIKYILVCVIFILQTIILIVTNFKFEIISTHAIIALTISVIYTLILVPAFLFMTNAILQEAIDESKLGDN